MNYLKRFIDWIDEDPGSFLVIAVFGILLFTGLLLGCAALYNDFIR